MLLRTSGTGPDRIKRNWLLDESLDEETSVPKEVQTKGDERKQTQGQGQSAHDFQDVTAEVLIGHHQTEVSRREQHAGKTYIRLKVAKEDMGRVIGRQGRVANAMRILLRVAAAQEGKRASLDVEDPR